MLRHLVSHRQWLVCLDFGRSRPVPRLLRADQDQQLSGSARLVNNGPSADVELFQKP